jgi:hypothetical protein
MPRMIGRWIRCQHPVLAAVGELKRSAVIDARDHAARQLSDHNDMKKLTCSLVLGVFVSCCLLAWSMLSLILDVRNAGRGIPYLSNLCIALRPALLMLPMVAAAYCLWLWVRKDYQDSRWVGFVVATMAVLMLFVLPAISTSYLLMIDQVRLATGAH